MQPCTRPFSLFLALSTTLWSVFSLSCNQVPGPPAQIEVRAAEPVAPNAYVPGASWDPLNDYARLLAGMPGGEDSPYRALRGSPAWQDHHWKMNSLWERVEDDRLSKIREWRQGELGGLTSHPLVFYPFSGPDFLFADAFFPDARTYVLCGLESPDLMPDFAELNDGEKEGILSGLHESLTTALNFSYFITKDMRVDLNRTKMSGVLPVLSIFLARTGNRITQVEPVSLDANGNVVQGNSGLRISCVARRGGNANTIYYFKEDLRNGEQKKNTQFLRFLSRQGTPVTYLKSASYLLHEPSFSTIRNAILDRSVAILQDDSGIPLSGFDTQRWRLTFYGNYSGVLDIFQKYYQQDLAQVYSTGAGDIRPMDFGVGYKFNRGESAQILAQRRH
ncbi:MAG: hypothetical protein O3C21_00615 [Verrucomicrobia bacterium]|nr:hypothetical protein [Verrucomicrobiota bacterium]